MAKKKESKLFRKPKAKAVKGLSAEKLVKQLGQEQGALVREVSNPYADPVQDNRSLFFKSEFETEKRKSFGGFL